MGLYAVSFTLHLSLLGVLVYETGFVLFTVDKIPGVFKEAGKQIFLELAQDHRALSLYNCCAKV